MSRCSRAMSVDDGVLSWRLRSSSRRVPFSCCRDAMSKTPSVTILASASVATAITMGTLLLHGGLR
jgi:hypothetical protein